MKLTYALIFSVCALSTGIAPSNTLAAKASSGEVKASNEMLTLQLAQEKEKVKQLKLEIAELRKTIDSLKSMIGNSGSTASTSATQTAQKYVIQGGETITQIAKRHNISREKLMEMNGITENEQIYIGDELIIPAAPSSQAENANEVQLVEAKVESSSPAALAVVIKEAPVSKVTTIAWTQAETVQLAPPTPAPAVVEAPQPEIKKEQAKVAEVKASAEQKAPNADPTFTLYTIKFGDNLGKIAKKHGISIGALMSFNKITNPNKIGGGQKLKIPSKATAKSLSKIKATVKPALVDNSSGDKPLADDAYGVYTVQTGDTLYELARDFFTTEKKIQELNKMGSSTKIIPGQDLIVPTAEYFKKSNLANN